MRRVSAAALLATLTLLTACSAAPSIEDDPAGALAAAFAALADHDGISLVADVSSDPGAADPPNADAAAADLASNEPMVALLVGSVVEIRSNRTESAHLRIDLADAPAAQASAERSGAQLRTVGLSPVADAFERGGWLRIATDLVPDRPEGDRIARGLGDAGTRLIEGATVTSLGEEDRGHRVQVDTGAATVQRFLSDTVGVLTDPGRPSDADGPEPAAPSPDGGADDASGDASEEPAGDASDEGLPDASIDVWIAEGELSALRIDLQAALGATSPAVTIDVTIAPVDGTERFAGDAPAVPLRTLTDTIAADRPLPDDGPDDGTADEDPAALEPERPDEGADSGPEPDDDPASRPRPTTPPELREGGVLEQVFGDGEVFVEGEGFDCLTDEDLAVFEEQLGPEAAEELDELITAGYVDRC